MKNEQTLQPNNFKYHVFVSYSTDPDYALVRKLESFLETFHELKTPKDVPLKPLNVCVDGSDFSIQKIQKKEGDNAVAALIDGYLSQSAELLVMCSGKACSSQWVNQEVKWFLKHRGPDSIRLAVTEGVDPGSQAEGIFSKTMLEAGLHQKPWYDFRESKGKLSTSWIKVKNFDDERSRLAADLNGVSAGEVQPIWYREQRQALRKRITVSAVAALFIVAAVTVAVYQGIVAKKEQGLKYISDAYKVLYRDPSQAVIKAYRGHQLIPGQASETALKTAFKVAILHHYNRRENVRITGSGPSYLAGRWKQGDVFSEDSPDGQYRLLVTEHGESGPNPPGEMYLLNNETLKVTKLEPCIEGKSRVEDVSFDQTSRFVFVTRYFNLSVYSILGECKGVFRFSQYTKSPIHLVEGFFADEYVLGSETKGGLWLVKPQAVEESHASFGQGIELQREFHGDPAVFANFSQDAHTATLIFESGRAAVLLFDQEQKKFVLKDLKKDGCLFAAFYPGDDSRVITTGTDGVIRIWQIQDRQAQESQNIPVTSSELDWVTLSEDKQYMLAVGDQLLYIIDAERGEVLDEINYIDEIDWATARAVSGQKEFTNIGIDSRKPEIKDLSDPSLAVSSILNVNGETWLISPSEQPYVTGGKPYRVERDKAYSYPAFSEYVSSIQKVGDFYWFSGGPLYRFVQNGLQVLPGENIPVVDVLQDGEGYWLATHKGLYRLLDDRLTRVSNEQTAINKLYRIQGRIYASSGRGVYILENDLIIRVTDPFLDVREIKYVGGKVWLLTKGDDMFEADGPLYVIDGYFSKRIGDSDLKVTDIFEARGKVWVSTIKGFYLYDETHLRAVSGMADEVVTAMNEQDAGLVLTTRTSGIFKNSAADYLLDVDALTATRMNVTGQQWKKYGRDTLAIKYKFDSSTFNLGPAVAVQRKGDREVELDLNGATVSSIEEINGQAWLATNKGVYRLVDDRIEKYPDIDMPIKTILQRGDEIWLLSNTAVLRIKGDSQQTFETENYASRELKEVAGDIWILTTADGTSPGPAFRLKRGQFEKIVGPTGSVDNVLVINDEVWLMTKRAAKAGPLYKLKE